MRLWRTIAAGLALLMVTIGTAAHAQMPEPLARLLARELTRVELMSDNNGYGRAAGPFSGSLNAREVNAIPLTMRAGQEYRIIAVCAERCGQIRLRLRDPAGVEVGESNADPGGAAILLVRPAFTGLHALDIDALRCAEPQCWYAVNVYAR